jgi:hypothetical protein
LHCLSRRTVIAIGALPCPNCVRLSVVWEGSSLELSRVS